MHASLQKGIVQSLYRNALQVYIRIREPKSSKIFVRVYKPDEAGTHKSTKTHAGENPVWLSNAPAIWRSVWRPTAIAEFAFSPAFVCLSVCLFVYPHDVSKIAAVRITKLDTEMVDQESWKPIYYGVTKVEGQGHEAQKQCQRGY